MGEPLKDIELGNTEAHVKVVAPDDEAVADATAKLFPNDEPLPPAYEDGHISRSHESAFRGAPTIRPADGADYFRSLVAHGSAASSLPRCYPPGRNKAVFASEDEDQANEPAGGEAGRAKPVPLYNVRADEHGKILPELLSGQQGLGLSLRKLIEMDQTHLLAQIRSEYAAMLTGRITDEAQLARVRSLLDYWTRTRKYRPVYDTITREDFYDTELEAVEDDLLAVRIALYRESHRGQDGQAPLPLRKRVTTQLTMESLKAAEKQQEKQPAFSWLNKLLAYFRLDKSKAWGTETVNSYIGYAHELRRKDAFDRKRIGPIRRFVLALVGGLALIVPLLIMALRPSLEKALITTCVAVAVFSLYLAIATDSLKETELLGSSAAYAAVLVVFVGVGLTPS